MKIGRQIAMVFNLDKCLGCNTCTVACKNVWTNREGAEYMWWNNVETKPGVGYPREWENQDKYRGGWKRTGNERKPVKLRARGKASELLNIFYNPVQPTLEDYAGKGPFSFTYEDLQSPERAAPAAGRTAEVADHRRGGDPDRVGRQLGGQRRGHLRDRQGRRQLQVHDRRRAGRLPRVREGVLLLPAADLQPLHESRLCGGLPQRRRLQARRGRRSS